MKTLSISTVTLSMTTYKSAPEVARTSLAVVTVVID
jgi:hypothetical protein